MAEVTREHRELAATYFAYDESYRAIEEWVVNGDRDALALICRTKRVEVLAMAQAIADAEERGAAVAFAEVRRMPYFDLMVSDLKSHRIKQRGACGQAFPSPYDYANAALVAVLKLLEGKP